MGVPMVNVVYSSSLATAQITLDEDTAVWLAETMHETLARTGDGAARELAEKLDRQLARRG